MGPDASAYFYKRLIDFAQQRYQAVQDTDFPPMMLFSLPLVGFDETGIADRAAVRDQLITGVQTLERAGSNFIVIACNTVHALYDDMQSAIQIPILNMIDVVSGKVESQQLKKVGLLSSQTTARLDLYQNKLRSSGIEVLGVTDEEQNIVTQGVLRVMAGTHTAEDTQKLVKMIERFRSQGAEACILGCTEIPLLLRQKDSPLPLFDAVDILSNHALQEAYGRTGEKDSGSNPELDLISSCAIL